MPEAVQTTTEAERQKKVNAWLVSKHLRARNELRRITNMIPSGDDDLERVIAILDEEYKE